MAIDFELTAEASRPRSAVAHSLGAPLPTHPDLLLHSPDKAPPLSNLALTNAQALCHPMLLDRSHALVELLNVRLNRLQRSSELRQGIGEIFRVRR